MCEDLSHTKTISSSEILLANLSSSCVQVDLSKDGLEHEAFEFYEPMVFDLVSQLQVERNFRSEYQITNFGINL